MPKSVGIITIQSANYGSTLQMFALYTIVNKLGYNCTIIDYQYPTKYHRQNSIGNENKYSQNILNPQVLIRKIGNLYKRIIRSIIKKKYPSNNLTNAFNEFISQCHTTSISYDKDSIIKNPPLFDIYMTGSDQVWNPRYYHRDYSFLLNFTKDKQKRVSYASSFGTKQFIEAYKDDYSKLLKRYDFVSTRERSGVALYEQLTGRKADYCLDPTMLLTKEEWKKYATPYTNKNERYILCYIQSYAFNPYPYIDKLIKRVKKITGYKVKIITQDFYEETKGYEVQYNVGPREFIDLYYNASFIIACSFHAIVFSIIMRKPFFTVINDKPTNDDRQTNIISEFGLEKRAYKKGDKLPQKKEELILDYNDIEKKIENLRESSMQYLKKILA
jgi:hypothetical protein